jgi:ABC-type antimicrobial peptide transport system permease subunit
MSGLVGAVLGYVAGGVLGYFLVEGLSSNTHDRSLEAAMTGAFVVGPFVAVVAFIFGFVRAGRKIPKIHADKS